MTTPKREMEAALEAILFVSSEPIARERLLEIFEEGEREEAAAALEAVLERYRGGDEEGRGLMVDEVAGGVRLVTRPELAGWLRRFFEVRGGSKLSMAALETLAIVAYRQPITGPEIQELRSVNPSGVLKTLLERRLVRIAGRKQVVGNPFLYRTTRDFLTHFGLGSLKDLPPLEEFQETFGLGGENGSGPGGGGLLVAGPEREEGEWAEGEEGEVGDESPPDREEIILRQAAELAEEEAEREDDGGPIEAALAPFAPDEADEVEEAVEEAAGEVAEEIAEEAR